MWRWTRGSSNPIAKSGKNSLDTYRWINQCNNVVNFWEKLQWLFVTRAIVTYHTSMTILSISHMSICSTELWREISLRTPPSPPPTTRTCNIFSLVYIFPLHSIWQEWIFIRQCLDQKEQIAIDDMLKK